MSERLAEKCKNNKQTTTTKKRKENRQREISGSALKLYWLIQLFLIFPDYCSPSQSILYNLLSVYISTVYLFFTCIGLTFLTFSILKPPNFSILVCMFTLEKYIQALPDVYIDTVLTTSSSDAEKCQSQWDDTHSHTNTNYHKHPYPHFCYGGKTVSVELLIQKQEDSVSKTSISYLKTLNHMKSNT